MKTSVKNILVVAFVLIQASVLAQSLAIGNIKTFGLFTSEKSVTKMTQLEVIKLKKYAVLDEFDIAEVETAADYDSCYGKTCLVEYGEALNVDYVLSGNIDGIENKIVINFKMIDVKAKSISINKSMEFDNQEEELQRMIGIVINEMHNVINDAELVKRLTFNNDVIVTNNYNKIKNSGPRIGMAYTTGSVNEFVTRPENEGGLEILPVVSNIGYQIEGQYVGTEKFSALVEGLVTFSGLEQGKFIPAVSLLNGYRFGNAGWEFAFGPSFSLASYTNGIFDTENLFGTPGKYWNESDLLSAGYDVNETNYELRKTLDRRGKLVLSTRWVMAFGRTFKSGALNIPVNIFYSSQKGGGMAGFSVGFNVTRSKTSVKTN